MAMRILSSIVLGLGLVAFAAGCGPDVTKDITKLADRSCACKDAACAKPVVDELVKLIQDNKNARADEETVQKDFMRLTECAVKAGYDPNELSAAMQKIVEATQQ